MPLILNKATSDFLSYEALVGYVVILLFFNHVSHLALEKLPPVIQSKTHASLETIAGSELKNKSKLELISHE